VIGVERIAERIGQVGIWAGQMSSLPADALRRSAAEVERLGFGSLWFGESFGREAFAHAALLLASTDALVVGTGIANIYARDPVAMANGGRTLEEAWPGRFVLGIGVSHAPSTQARGHEYGRPVAQMRTYLDGMAAAPWRVGTGGDPPMPPVVLAALGPRMLELARDRTAGAHPYFVTADHTRRAREILGPGPLLVPEMAVVLARDRREARDVGDRYVSLYLGLDNYRNNLARIGWAAGDLEPPGSDALFDAVVAWGDEAAVAERVRQHLEAGADSVLLQPLTRTPEAAYTEELRRLAALARIARREPN
jgi:probable F420-dependent oxidoreductase